MALHVIPSVLRPAVLIRQRRLQGPGEALELEVPQTGRLMSFHPAFDGAWKFALLPDPAAPVPRPIAGGFPEGLKGEGHALPARRYQATLTLDNCRISIQARVMAATRDVPAQPASAVVAVRGHNCFQPASARHGELVRPRSCGGGARRDEARRFAHPALSLPIPESPAVPGFRPPGQPRPNRKDRWLHGCVRCPAWREGIPSVFAGLRRRT